MGVGSQGGEGDGKVDGLRKKEGNLPLSCKEGVAESNRRRKERSFFWLKKCGYCKG